MSHQDYIAGCDEDQLKRLVEMANERLTKIRESGWVNLWTVSVGWGNVAWFEMGNYDAAIDRACLEVRRQAATRHGKGIEMTVSLERYRPEEVPELLATKEK